MTDKEINGFIAEKCLGWKPNGHGGFVSPEYQNSTGIWTCKLPEPLTNADDLQMCKQAMRENGWCYVIRFIKRVRVDFWNPATSPVKFKHKDPDESRAVCLAIVKALGGATE